MPSSALFLKDTGIPVIYQHARGARWKRKLQIHSSRLLLVYWLRLDRGGDRVRLITRGDYNWADRYPWIIEAARTSAERFVLVVLGA